MAETVNQEEDTPLPAALLRGQSKNQPWWVLVLIATLPATVTAFFSYRAAVVDAKLKAAESKNQAEAGYEATKKAVEQLVQHDLETGRALAGVLGHIDAIEKFLTIHTREERIRAATTLRLPPAIPQESVKKVSSERVELPSDLATALRYTQAAAKQ